MIPDDECDALHRRHARTPGHSRRHGLWHRWPWFPARLLGSQHSPLSTPARGPISLEKGVHQFLFAHRSQNHSLPANRRFLAAPRPAQRLPSWCDIDSLHDYFTGRQSFATALIKSISARHRFLPIPPCRPIYALRPPFCALIAPTCP